MDEIENSNVPVGATGRHADRDRLLALLLTAERQRSRRTQQISTRGDFKGRIPLSYAQERLWFLDQVGLVGAAYNEQLPLRLTGNLHEEALDRAFTELIRRHEILRTHFEEHDSVPCQVVEPARQFTMLRLDFSDLADPETREARVRDVTQRESLQKFELRGGELWRALLVRLGADEHILIVTFHHIVVDGWSAGVLARELGALYGACVKGESSPLPELEVQYADYAIWQRSTLQGELLEEQLKYWKDRLLGASPLLRLPTDRPRPHMETFKGAAFRFRFRASLVDQLQRFARAHGATLYMVMLAAYQLMLARWSGQQDIVVGAPIAGRKHRELENLIGFFVNTIALRTDVRKELTFRALLEQVKEVTLGAYAHQEMPFEVLVRELRPERNLTHQPIFQTMLTLRNYPEQRLELPGLTWRISEAKWVTSHFDLTLFLFGVSDAFTEVSEGMLGIFEYATDLFDEATIRRMSSHYVTLLEGILADPDASISKLPLIPQEEKRQLLLEWNDTKAAVPSSRCVHELFEEQVTRTPNAIAVEYEGQLLTYAELNAKANQLARDLLSLGVAPDDLVAICVGRSLEMVIGLLGIMKAGAAYLPLDPNYPPDRLQYMIEDAAPRVVLVHDELRATLPPGPAEVVQLNGRLREISEYVRENVRAGEIGLNPTKLVYVIYTSGSTGRPKGTAMPHRAMVNLIEWHRKHLPASGMSVLQFAALSFDVAFQEIFSTLSTGGRLVLINEWLRRDARALAELLRTRKVQRLFVPPMMLQQLADIVLAAGALPASLRDVIVAGEQLRVTAEIATFFKRLPAARLHNHYGPTESHVVTSLTLEGNPDAWPALPSIGRPIWNTRIHILDEYRQPVPIGVTGEVYIGGAGVARGYRGRAELTAERFIADPFDDHPDARLYKTGDLGRWTADGYIEYLGRNDDQVKIRGYRIELGEIEEQLARHRQVKEAAVVAREDSPGQLRLVAYFTARAGSAAEVDELRDHLSASLPEYMVPSAFVMLEELPLTPNGKLDRRGLPAPSTQDSLSRRYEPPSGDIEEGLAKIWEELLPVDRVGRNDNFFELGGHSLHGMKLVSKVSQRFGVDLPVIAIFQQPTIRQMADAVESIRLLASDTDEASGLPVESGVL